MFLGGSSEGRNVEAAAEEAQGPTATSAAARAAARHSVKRDNLEQRRGQRGRGRRHGSRERTGTRGTWGKVVATLHATESQGGPLSRITTVLGKAVEA
jgi:hypothetical protein